MPYSLTEPGVSAADLVRNFAHWCDVGGRRPLLVTHHGRATHVFMGLEKFRLLALRGQSAQQGDRVRGLAARLSEGIILCSSDCRIEFANAAALGIVKRCDAQLEGQLLWEALPALQGSLLEAHFRHSQSTGEISAADFPSPFREHNWLRFQIFPLANSMGILLHDISDEVRHRKISSNQSAVVKALAMLPHVGQVQLSNRAFIDFADQNFCRLIELPSDRLANVCILDLLHPRARGEFKIALEAVFRGEGARRLETQFHKNNSTFLTIDCALVERSGVYGIQGVTMVVTATCDSVTGATK